VCVGAERGLAQTPSAPATAGIDLQKGLSLADEGRCREALPALRNGVAHIADKKLRLSAAMAQARCGMAVADYDAAVSALLQMKRLAPLDPQVLYVWTHYFSQLADRTARQLVSVAPESIEAKKLQAEALESQQKWAEASGLYREILQKDPQAADIHYRLAQILLEQPSSDNTQQARNELQEELKVNPKNAAAEFVLGELARREGQWDTASKHFVRAAELDAGFIEASLALGMSLNSAGKFAEAVPPLERYAKLQPEDPAGHYQLAIAYARTGNKAGAARESQLQRETAAKAPNRPH
jgi:tetratricopeptide (TPR) repeat protein